MHAAGDALTIYIYCKVEQLLSNNRRSCESTGLLSERRPASRCPIGEFDPQRLSDADSKSACINAVVPTIILIIVYPRKCPLSGFHSGSLALGSLGSSHSPYADPALRTDIYMGT